MSIFKIKQLIEQVVAEELRDIDEDLETRERFVKDLKDLGYEKGEEAYFLKRKFEDEAEESLNALQRRKDNYDSKTARFMAAQMKAYMELGRPIKKLFHKYADHEWLKTLTLVHYASAENVLKVLKVPSKDELSAIAYLPGKLQGSNWGTYGIILKGHITLLANDMDQLNTSTGAAYAKADPERTKSSGANKGIYKIWDAHHYLEPLLVFDEEDWDPKHNKSYGTHGIVHTYNNEALVDNWRPVAVFVGSLADASEHESLKQQMKHLLADNGINIPVLTFAEARRRF
jgi:hypothetical protein